MGVSGLSSCFKSRSMACGTARPVWPPSTRDDRGLPDGFEPDRGFVAGLREVEARPGILSVSLVHGFPWGDVADVGAKALVVADADVVSRSEPRKRSEFASMTCAERLRTECLSVDQALSETPAGSGELRLPRM